MELSVHFIFKISSGGISFQDGPMGGQDKAEGRLGRAVMAPPVRGIGVAPDWTPPRSLSYTV